MPLIAVKKGFQQLAHRREVIAIEQRPHALPQQALAPQFRPDRSEEGTAQLLGLVHQKREYHDRGKHHGKILLAMAIVVLKMVALIFQRIERLIFNLPPRPATAHERIDVTFTHPQVRHPTEVLDLVLSYLPILHKIDSHVRSRGIERHVVQSETDAPPPRRGHAAHTMSRARLPRLPAPV